MNVLMISNNYKGCSYVRLHLPAYHNGYNIADSKSELSQKLKGADVVVFHRPESEESYNLAKILKEEGKKIVMDNDDTFRMKDDPHPLARFKPDAVEVELGKREDSVVNFMKLADLVTASTEVLAEEYRENSDNVIVLPNCVDQMDWDEPLRNEGKKVRIGLVGSVTMEYDYRHIKGVLRKLSDRKDVQLCMFGLGDKKHRKENPGVTKAFKDDYDFWDSLDIEHQPWCDISDYPRLLNEAKLDMMLIPRKDNYFNRCKSNVKFLEAAMCEVPVIAQSFEDGPYEEITPGINGMLVIDNKEWMTQINWMIKNKGKRREIGKQAKEYALNNYNIEVRHPEWDEAYRKLYED